MKVLYVNYPNSCVNTQSLPEIAHTGEDLKVTVNSILTYLPKTSLSYDFQKVKVCGLGTKKGITQHQFH